MEQIKIISIKRNGSVWEAVFTCSGSVGKQTKPFESFGELTEWLGEG